MSVLQNIRGRLRGGTDALMRTVLKNSGWAVAGQMATAGETFIETFMLARYFSLKELGLFYLMVNVPELIFGLLDFRTGEAVIKFLPEFERRKGKGGVSTLLRFAFSVDLAVALAGLLLVLILRIIGVQLAGVESRYAELLTIVAVGTAFRTMVRSVGAYLRVTGAFATAVKLSVLTAVLRLAIMSVAAVAFGTLKSISIGSAMSDGVFFTVLVGGCLMAVRSYGVHPGKASLRELERTERRELFKFLFSTNIAGTMRVLSTKLDVVVIAALSSPAVVALYKIAARLAGSLMLFSDPLLVAIYPELSKLHASGQEKDVRRLVRTMTGMLAALAFVLVLGFGIFGRWILGELAAPQYAQAHSTVMYMFAGTSLSMIFFWARPMLLIYGLAGRLVLVAFVALVVQFGLLALLVPVLGADGGGIAFASVYIVQILLLLFLVSGRMREADAG